MTNLEGKWYTAKLLDEAMRGFAQAVTEMQPAQEGAKITDEEWESSKTSPHYKIAQGYMIATLDALDPDDIQRALNFHLNES